MQTTKCSSYREAAKRTVSGAGAGQAIGGGRLEVTAVGKVSSNGMERKQGTNVRAIIEAKVRIVVQGSTVADEMGRAVKEDVSGNHREQEGKRVRERAQMNARDAMAQKRRRRRNALQRSVERNVKEERERGAKVKGSKRETHVAKREVRKL
eukprot:1162686-Pleurochrysis_carterae.AAC.1